MHTYWKQLRISAIVHQDHLLSAGGSAASTPYHHSPIFSIPALLKLNSSIRSYTLLYRILTFRHIEYWKNLYRCSGTFRQKWLWIFGYFVYWFLLLTCSAFYQIIPPIFSIFKCRTMTNYGGKIYPSKQCKNVTIEKNT